MIYRQTSVQSFESHSLRFHSSFVEQSLSLFRTGATGLKLREGRKEGRKEGKKGRCGAAEDGCFFRP
jgi:hypothetical protein